MARPNTTFEKPEFALIPDRRARDYANVNNVVARIRANGRETEHPTVIPTELFTLMLEVFKVDPSERVTLYVVDDGDYAVFGMAWGEDDNNVADLWAYTSGSLPSYLR